MNSAILFALFLGAFVTLATSNEFELEGPAAKLTCADLKNCLKCSRNGDTFSFDASSCKSGGSLSWMCVRGLSSLGLGQCSGSKTENKCDEFLTTSYTITGDLSNKMVQVHDGQLCGDYTAAGTPNPFGSLTAKSTCGGAGGGCGSTCNSCVCNLRLSDVCAEAATCAAIPDGASFTSACSSGTTACGGTCKLTCKPGFTGSSTKTCDSAGWTGSNPTCVPDSCAAIPDGGSGSSVYSSGCSDGSSPSGSECDLTCAKPGYSGSATQTCFRGQWTGSAPVCTPGITCKSIRDCMKCTHKGVKVEIDLAECKAFCSGCSHGHSLGWMTVSQPATSSIWGCDGYTEGNACTDVQRAAWAVDGNVVTVQVQDNRMCSDFEGSVNGPTQGLEGCPSGVCQFQLNLNDPQDCKPFDPEVDPPIPMNDRPCVISRRAGLIERKEQKGTQRILNKMMPKV